MPKSSILIRPAELSDAQSITPFIMMAMTDDCCLHFCDAHHTLSDFHALLDRMVVREDTLYSYLRAIIAEDTVSHRIIGLSLSYDGADLHRLRQPFVDDAIHSIGLSSTALDDETSPGEWYLDSLAVHPDYRCRGIASALVRATLERAVRHTLPLGLLVDDQNLTAQRFYRRLGFQFRNFCSWGGHPMRHLQIPLPQHGL